MNGAGFDVSDLGIAMQVGKLDGGEFLPFSVSTLMRA